MSQSIVHALAQFAGAATAVAINALWEGALLVACIWLLLRAWPGINASTRYIVWSATLIATVVVPVATTLPFLAPPSLSAATAEAVRVPIPMVTHALIAPPRANAPSQRAQTGAARSPQYSALAERFRLTLPLGVVLAVVVVWSMLALLALVRLAIGLARLEQLKRDALPLPIEYREAMARWMGARKGRRDVRLCVSDDIDVPVAVGLFDAMILIPRELLERLSESEVDQISLHELAHLRRADDWSNGLQRLIGALFGWNPAVSFVSQQLDLEREVACDDWVLAATGSVRPYAVCLAKMAETSSWPRHAMPAPGVFATRKHISLRIERLLGAGRNVATSLSLGPAAVTIAIVGGLAFAMQLVAPSVAASLQPPAVANAKGAPATATAGDLRQAIVVRSSPVPKTKEVVKYVQVLAAVGSPEPMPAHGASAHVRVPASKTQVVTTDARGARETIVIPPVDVDVPAVAKTAIVQAVGAAKAVADANAAKVVADVNATKAVAEVNASKAVAEANAVRNCNRCDLTGANWAGRDMRNANFTGSDLSRSNLVGTNFAGGTFNGVDFSGSRLRGASFRNARLTGCDFSQADLTGTDFTGAILTGCQFTNATLTSAVVHSILNSCTGCDFARADLGGADLSRVHVRGADFSGANLTGANLSDSTFIGVDFGGARLTDAILNGTVFNGCDLGSTDLTNVDLSKARFIGREFPTRASPKP